MKTYIKNLFIMLALLVGTLNLRAQGTAFTYQGRLTDGTNAANGRYDLTFSLFSVSSGAGQVGSTYPAPATAVSNGLFTVALDFGANFSGANRWLEIGVRTNGSVGAYTTLSPRQALTATPYAIMAGNAGNLGGQPSTTFAPATGSPNYVAKAGDTMTGGLNIISPQHALAMTANGPDVTFKDTAHSNARDVIQSVNGDLSFFTESYMSGANLFSFLKVANNGNVGIGTATPLSALDVNGNINYGQLTKLDVADNFTATVRAGDFLFGYSGRRGSPGRALVDNTDTLDINLGPDWANTGIWGNNIVAHGYVSLEANRTYVHGFDATGFHWFSYGTDADLMLGLHRNGTNSYDFTVNGTTYTRALTVTGGNVILTGGDVTQPVNNNGLVKAMLYVDSSGAIIRCFNGITDVSGGGCGFTVTRPLSGVFRINFGFPVSDRFVSVTAEFDSYGGFLSHHNAGANYRFYDSTSVEVFTFDSGSSTDLAPAKFMIILY